MFLEQGSENGTFLPEFISKLTLSSASFFKGEWVDFHPGGFIAVAIVQFIHHDKSELGKKLSPLSSN